MRAKLLRVWREESLSQHKRRNTHKNKASAGQACSPRGASGCRARAPGAVCRRRWPRDENGCKRTQLASTSPWPPLSHSITAPLALEPFLLPCTRARRQADTSTRGQADKSGEADTGARSRPA